MESWFLWQLTWNFLNRIADFSRKILVPFKMHIHKTSSGWWSCIHLIGVHLKKQSSHSSSIALFITDSNKEPFQQQYYCIYRTVFTNNPIDSFYMLSLRKLTTVQNNWHVNLHVLSCSRIRNASANTGQYCDILLWVYCFSYNLRLCLEAGSQLYHLMCLFVVIYPP